MRSGLPILAARVLLIGILLAPVAHAQPDGLMRAYSHEGTFALSGGKATIIIERDAQQRFQYRIQHRNDDIGQQAGGSPGFLKSPRFFIFAENSSQYWIYGGKSDIIYFTFSGDGMTQEQFSSVPEHFRAMPKAAVALLPASLQKQIQP